MTNPEQPGRCSMEVSEPTATLRITFTFLLVGVIAVACLPMHAQTFTVIHSFTGHDGSNPVAGVTMDQAGNLWGTTELGGGANCDIGGCGTVYKLTHVKSGWVLSQLYAFQGGDDGQYPSSKVTFAPDGTIYSNTQGGSVGTVFRLRPPSTFCHSISCPWTKTTVASFGGGNGSYPSGDLTFDAAGNIYGTTGSGGRFKNCGGGGCGIVYELTPSGGSWTENVLYTFTDGADGGHPESGVIFDQSGHLFGTATIDNLIGGGDNGGVIFELVPSGSGWTETVLYHLQDPADGGKPYGGLIFDAAGNLYGTNTYGGSGDGGTVFELSPSGGYWNLNLLYSLTCPPGGYIGPYGKLVQDSSGNLYGASVSGGTYNYGYIFKLTPSNGSWSFTDLHDFTNGDDGAWPYDGLTLAANGNLYGTTFVGGQPGQGCYYGFNCGVIFEITP